MAKDKLKGEFVKDYFSRNGTVAKWWDPEVKEHNLNHLFSEQKIDVIRITGPRDRTVLDAGTGKGRFAISFALAGAKKVMAMDISNEMLAEAKRRAEEAGVVDRIIFESGDIEQLKYEDEAFDIVCCLETFVHLSNPQKAMSELSRVCKRGGLLVANVTNSNCFWQVKYRFKLFIFEKIREVYFWRALLPLRLLTSKYFGKPIKKPKPIAKLYSKKEFLKLFEEAGLKSQTICEYGSPVPVFFTVFARRLKY